MPGQSNKKKIFTESLSEQWVSYSQSMSECIPNILLELERETHQKVLKPRMISGPLQGRLLSLLSSLINPKIIVEIGTYTGYSRKIFHQERLQEKNQTISRGSFNHFTQTRWTL